MSNRILGRRGGERLLTDIRHLGQLLHDRAVRERLGLTALLEWFRDERLRTAAGERPRRLDSDAQGRADRHDPRQQGPRVPRRLPALRLQLLRARRRRPRSSTTGPSPGGCGGSSTSAAAAGSGRTASPPTRPRRPARTCASSTSRSPGRSRRSSRGGRRPTAPSEGALHRILFGRRPGDREVLPVGAACSPTSGPQRSCGLIETRVRRAGGRGRRGRTRLGSRRSRRRRPAAGGAGVRPADRHRVAAYVVLRADPGRGAGDRDQRAGGAGQGRRAGRGRGRGAGGRRRRRRSPRLAEPPVADGRPAGRRRLRVAGPRDPRARRPRGARPARRAAGARRGAAPVVAVARRRPTSSPTRCSR